jgi:hypothetical protein
MNIQPVCPEYMQPVSPLPGVRGPVRGPLGPAAPEPAVVDRLHKAGINLVTSTPAKFDVFFRGKARVSFVPRTGER